MMNNTLLLYLILIPLAGALIAYFAERIKSFEFSLSGLVATLASVASFIITLKLTAEIAESGKPASFVASPWIELGSFKVLWSFTFDNLTAVMCLLITGVGSLIHVFSCGYMKDDPGRSRFFAYLNLFLASMLILVLGSNLPVTFIGWEGVGLCSYLLIGFWYSNSDYNKAAQKAFVMNRIGDLGLLIAMFIIYYNFSSLDYSAINERISAGGVSSEILFIIGSCLLLGAIGKSAQLPLFTWLPDAMAGPTPVSALIHAATMVTAGIYLLVRVHPIVDASTELQFLIASIAIITAFITATTALVQNDIKKILAYSTVSQLGFMFAAVASGAYWIAIFHVITHGFFKACLFLGAGAVIHGCHHEQDIRKMGGLRKKMPLTFISFALATLAIAGLAPFSGYYSKHAILESFKIYSSSAEAVNSYLPVMADLLMLTSLLTAFYMGRCLFSVFFGQYKGEHEAHEVPFVMSLPVLALAVLSVISGFILMPVFQTFLSALESRNVPVDLHVNILSDLKHSWTSILSLVAAFVCFTAYKSKVDSVTKSFSVINRFLFDSYMIDRIYSLLIISPLRYFSWILWKLGDQLLLSGVEHLGVTTVRSVSYFGGLLQNGQVRSYIAYLLLGLIGLIALLFYGF